MEKAKKIRYAVVGLGHIAQEAVLPAFAHAKVNSELRALVSGDAEKLRKLGRRYGVDALYSYEQFEDCLASGDIDAVYICTPNNLHQRFAEIAASYKVHVLCEKPMATEELACESMIETARENDVKLMIAYRLHFDPTNLKAISLAQSQIGNPKIFNSVFTMQVRDETNIRLQRAMGGGTLYDIGIYCINAARYLFQDEPIEVFAMTANSGDPRFTEIDEITSAILRFPNERLATFTTSFGATDSGDYDLIGTEGRVRVSHAYEYAEGMELELHKDGKTKTFRFDKHDQFAPELIYFSNCILDNVEPEPSGEEGLADVQVIEALLESARSQQLVKVEVVHRIERPSLRQKIVRPALRRTPSAVHATAPGEKKH